MPEAISNNATESCIRKILSSEGYHLTPERKFGETGVDIIATRGEEIFHIEVIGYKKSGPARAKDFYESFFRAISRIKDGATKCVIAMPINAKIGLPTRAKQYGPAWDRIGHAFIELEIWLIDLEGESYEKSFWLEWSQQ